MSRIYWSHLTWNKMQRHLYA
uniref:Uncharacterized protein n=1 Tax=Anguilla anguilla TaxID=7936 RepID=A0A0E9UM66_ANGAN